MPKMPSKTDVMILKIKLNNIAHQRLSTLKESIIWSAIQIIIALIKSKNIPNVSTVSGMVKTTKSGFINVFKNDSTIASIRAVTKGLSPNKCTPGNKYEAIITATAEISI